MKRLALALAALVVGSGCIVSSDTHPVACDGTITTDWAFTYWSSGSNAWIVNAGCGPAAVATVDVWMDGQLVDNLPCSAGGITITQVPMGTHAVDVEGLASNGAILYRDSLSVPVTSCVDHYVPASPAEGFINVDYSAPGGCTSSPCWLWLSVHDDIANQLAVAYSGSGGSTTFQYPNDVVLRLPVGSYSLDWMQLVSSSFTQVARGCAPLPTFGVAPQQSASMLVSPAVNIACQ